MDRHIRLTPLTLFCAYLLKSLIISASMADAGIVLCLGTLVIYFDWAVNRKQITALEKKVADMETTTAKDVEFLKNNIASVKMSTGLRSSYQQK